ncbi:LysM peptidoglycan-binding domain-containing protein [Halobacillus shinanisalinarum]|uniref:LysM peptidoglycan-binding domain-containing protein n=1 Tax=Halobacillus shinanisalinarum TaxID=2932258 RepID=A0ABY4GUA2_9BACI|nr:LysM peptidoglycan-binding domain-containing protein [Halobacillus shinanisalinarum]UOQ91723.1 LysM peptidoglycan-binding domain-containing protein [Halobacillus shinanisalinarum]
MQIHVVQKGEALWSIAQIYGSNINQIILANQLENPNILVVGQALVVPDPSREYVVQPGDNLWSIAQMYGVSIEQLIEVNNIANPSLIYVGGLLELPYFPHRIQPGDTLWGLAQRYGTTVDQIIRANNITNASLIYSGSILRIPAPAKPVAEVNAYTTQLNAQGTQEVMALGANLTYLSPFLYTIEEDGSITELQDLSILEAAKANNIAPLLVLTNFSAGTFSSDLAASILRDPDLQETLITNLIEKIKTKGYAGINFDFEYVYSEDRENYNAFLRRVVTRFRPQGLLVSTALAPKDSADQEGLLYEAHDYQAHGEIVDFVVLMTYEWGWAGGRPWAIAPINEVREVLDYAVTVIPRSKILMGIPLYGRVWEIPWVEGTTARTISPKEAVQLAARYGVAIQYNKQYQSPFFRYVGENGQRYEVWFEDARSVEAKYETIKSYGLRGAAFWSLGNPFPQNWAVLQDNFQIRKL